MEVNFVQEAVFHRDYWICLNMSSRTSSYCHSPQNDFQHNSKKPDDRSPASRGYPKECIGTTITACYSSKVDLTKYCSSILSNSCINPASPYK